jgi:cytoskeleton protein RodZ
MPDNAKKIEMVSRGANVASKQSALGLGERLRSARKARALSLEHLSDALHLDETIILALEDERFEVLGAPVFVRGHLKAYARLVGLAPDSVLAAFDKTDKLPEVIPTSRRETDRSVTVNPVLWGFWALVILLAFGLGIYLLLGDGDNSSTVAPAASTAPPESRLDADLPASGNVLSGESKTSQREEQNSDQSTMDQLNSDPLVVLPDAGEAAESQVDTGALSAAIDEVEASPQVAPEPAPALSDEPMRLSLYFLQESWVEIRDADRRLLFGLQREGRRRDLTGQPPFQLLLGNAKGVELRLNGKPYNIPVTVLSGKVARFSITRAEIE